MISIIIINYNVKKHLKLCLDSISSADIKYKYEIIIIDNNSIEKIEDLRNVNIEVFNMDENLGFSKAVNFGISKSSGDTILLLNPDTLINNNTINVLYEYLSDNSGVGVVGCKVLNSDGSYQLSSKRKLLSIKILISLFFKLNKFFPKSKYFGSYNYSYENHNRILDVDSVSGSCMMFKNKISSLVGGFDENFFLYFEDTDFCLQVKKYNYRVVYNPNTSIIHYKRVSINRSDYELRYEFYKSMDYFVKKNMDEFSNWFFLSKVVTFIKFLSKFYYYKGSKYSLKTL